MSSGRSYAIDAIDARRAIGSSVLVAGPAVEPVTVDTLKRHSRLNDSGIDADLIPLRIAAARSWVEAYTGLTLIRQTWGYGLDYLTSPTVPVLLPKCPLIDVVAITSFDPDDVPTTVPIANYRVDVGTVPGRVFLDSSVGHWVANPRPYGSLRIEYRAGYGLTPTDVPMLLRHAVLLLAAELCERLETATDLSLMEVPFGVRSLLDPFRVRV